MMSRCLFHASCASSELVMTSPDNRCLYTSYMLPGCLAHHPVNHTSLQVCILSCIDMPIGFFSKEVILAELRETRRSSANSFGARLLLNVADRLEAMSRCGLPSLAAAHGLFLDLNLMSNEGTTRLPETKCKGKALLSPESIIVMKGKHTQPNVTKQLDSIVPCYRTEYCVWTRVLKHTAFE